MSLAAKQGKCQVFRRSDVGVRLRKDSQILFILKNDVRNGAPGRRNASSMQALSPPLQREAPGISSSPPPPTSASIECLLNSPGFRTFFGSVHVLHLPRHNVCRQHETCKQLTATAFGLGLNLCITINIMQVLHPIFPCPQAWNQQHIKILEVSGRRCTLWSLI